MYYKSERADQLATKQIVVSEIIQQFTAVYFTMYKELSPTLFSCIYAIYHIDSRILASTKFRVFTSTIVSV